MTFAVALLYAVSGAIALGLETAWARAVALVAGASHLAHGLVLAAFMLGMSAGAATAARAADAARRPLRVYAALEGFVGLFALVAPAVLEALRRASGTGLPVSLLALLVLAVPATAMGATFPFIARALVLRGVALPKALALLYTTNTAGGVLGSLGVGLALLPSAGLAGSTRLLGLGALVVATLAATVRAPAPAVASAVPPAGAPSAGAPGSHDAVALSLLALLGVLSFTLQVAYGRVFALLFGSAAYTFAEVVASVLLGLSLGGLRVATTDPGDAYRRASLHLVGLAVWSFLSTLAVRAAPHPLYTAAADAARYTVTRLVLFGVVVVLPMHHVGALFPLLASRTAGRGPGEVVGWASLASTLGNLAGALLAAFVLLPLVGLRGTLISASAGALVLAIVAAARAGRRALVGTLGAAAVAVVLAQGLLVSWDWVSLSAGTFRREAYGASEAERERDDAPCGPSRRTRSNELLFHEDGAMGSVVVLGHDAGEDCSLYSLRVGGKAEGSVYVAAKLAPEVPLGATLLPQGDVPTQRLAGALPTRCGESRERAFLVGWGTGLSARALLDAGIQSAIAVEIEPAVLRASRVFDPSLLDDPRVALRLGDARAVLAAEPAARYDVIVSQPSNPWVVGSASLFSREYFELLRARLAKGGRALAWVQLYEIDDAALRSFVRTVTTVFPSTYAYSPAEGSRDLLLVAFADDGARCVEPGGAWPVAGPPELAAYATGGRISTDDNAFMEMHMADVLRRGRGDDAKTLLRALASGTRP